MGLLLSSGEPPAVDVRNGGGPFLIVCEHASNRIPVSLRNLGLQSNDLGRHIAWDLGAREVAEGMFARLGGAIILQQYSRLVVDCNRSLDLHDAFTTFSEDTRIPGNVGLSEHDKALRIAEIWTPFHAAVDDVIESRNVAGLRTVLVTVHSFTPIYRGESRPLHIGIISTEERHLADNILNALGQDPALIVGDNEPYSARDNVDYTIRRHGRNRRLLHVMIEIRNDIIADEAGRDAWAERLASILNSIELDELEARGVLA